MKIASWKPIKDRPELYSFSLSLEGLLVNGFLYNSRTNQVLSPLSSNKFKVVRGWGRTWQRIQALCKEKLAGD